MKKFEFSDFIAKANCIIATQFRSSIKLLRSLHMPFLKIVQLGKFGWMKMPKQAKSISAKLEKYGANIQMSLGETPAPIYDAIFATYKPNETKNFS